MQSGAEAATPNMQEVVPPQDIQYKNIPADIKAQMDNYIISKVGKQNFADHYKISPVFSTCKEAQHKIDSCVFHYTYGKSDTFMNMINVRIRMEKDQINGFVGTIRDGKFIEPNAGITHAVAMKTASDYVNKQLGKNLSTPAYYHTYFPDKHDLKLIAINKNIGIYEASQDWADDKDWIWGFSFGVSTDNPVCDVSYIVGVSAITGAVIDDKHDLFCGKPKN